MVKTKQGCEVIKMSKQISNVIAFLVIMAIVFIAVVVTCDNQYYLDLGYLMLLVAIASSSLESYAASNRLNIIHYSLGITRQEVYKDYIKRLLSSCLLCILLVLVSSIANSLVVGYNIYLVLLSQHVVFLVAVYFLSNILFTLIGYKKVKEPFVFLLLIIEFLILLFIKSASVLVDIIGIALILVSIILLLVLKKITYTRIF